MQTDVIAAAIVRDEPNFGATVAQLASVIGPALKGVVIHDTGSNPPLEIESDDRFPIYVYQRPFDDFASARNACLGSASMIARGRRAGWLFMFSAGAEFSGKWSPPRRSRHEALSHVERLGSHEFVKICTVQARSALRFSGRTHEAISAPVLAEELDPCGLVVDYSKDWNLEKKKRRWALDIDLLKDDYSPRGRFYLAQSFKNLGIIHEAFCYYMARLTMQGYEPERREAACGAIQTAPTIELARFAAAHAPDCADVQLSLAERELRQKNPVETMRAVVLASALEERSMFANVNLYNRCAEITAALKA